MTRRVVFFAEERTVLLDHSVCDRARIARDARFDGRFISGVLTTRIYCRPVCPVKPARSENVIFFPTAAAAEQAGFRPCLRCRPEAAPGSPAWRGTGATVSRALALINQGALDAESVDDLAATLGIGARHLARLFVKYVGAPPTDVARTRRVQVAKMLLDEASLPIAQIAFAAGFSSIRRFNAAFVETYGRPPSVIRRSRYESTGDGRSPRIRLTYRPPFCWPAAVRLLDAESTPGVEDASLDGYRRTVTLDGHDGWLQVRPVASRDELELSVWLPGYGRLRTVVERVRTMFDLDADPRHIAEQLSSDARLAPLLGRSAALRLPGAWDGFEVAVYRRVADDVGVPEARRVMARLARACGRRLEPAPERGPDILFPTPRALSRLEAGDLGLSRQAARDIRRLAAATDSGQIRFDPVTSCESLVERLMVMAGFDAPTAHWIAMRTLAESDAVPFGAEPFPSAKSPATWSHRRLQRWRPWRSYVAILGLRSLASASTQ